MTVSNAQRVALALISLAAAGCIQTPTYARGPRPSLADFEQREDCLFKRTAEQVSQYRAKGLDPNLGETDIASTATGWCSRFIWEKINRSMPTPSAYYTNRALDEINTDRIETELHAVSITRYQIAHLPR